MKREKQAAIVLLLIAGVGLSIYLVYALSTRGVNNNGRQHIVAGVQSVNLVNTQRINMSYVEDIAILYDHTSMDIEFYESDSESLVIKEYMYDAYQEDEFAIIKKDDTKGKVTIESGRRSNTIMFFGIMTGNERVEVYLPKNFRGQIKADSSSGNVSCFCDLELEGDFKVKASSGDVKTKFVSAANIQVTTSSGNINMNKAEGSRTFAASSGNITILDGRGDSTISTTSGNVDVSNMEGKFKISCSSGEVTLSDIVGNGRITTTSGNIRIKEMNGNLEEVKASSGDITIAKLTGMVEAQSTSGTISIKFDNILGDIRAEASSGDIKIGMPKDKSFSFSANTSSGDISTWFDSVLRYNKRGNEAEGTVGEKPEFAIKISTTSGNVKMIGN